MYTLKALDKEALGKIISKALNEDHDLKKIKVTLKETEALFNLSGGDARKVLNLLELVIRSEGSDKVTLTNDKVTTIAQRKTVQRARVAERQ